MNTPTVLDSAACTLGERTNWLMCAEPISSSPSATSTRFTGSFVGGLERVQRGQEGRSRGPFWFTAPRPIITLPTLGLSTMRPSSGGELHSAGSYCLTSYMKYTPTVFGAPASRVANTPGLPSVAMIST